MNNDVENFILDMTSLARTPNANSFILNREVVEEFVRELVQGYPTAQNMKINLVDKDMIPDAFTVQYTFMASGFNGMVMDEPSKFINRMVIGFLEIFAKLLWGAISAQSVHNEFKSKVSVSVFKIGPFTISMDRQAVIKNNMPIKDILENEILYKAFIEFVDKHYGSRWYGGSNAMLNISTLKDYKGMYFIDPKDYNFIMGDNPKFMDRSLVYDEFIDYGEYKEDTTPSQRIFFGGPLVDYVNLSDTMLVDRDLVYVSKDKTLPRKMTDISPLVDEDGVQYLPAIRYNVSLKVSLSGLHPRKWLIVKS